MKKNSKERRSLALRSIMTAAMLSLAIAPLDAHDLTVYDRDVKPILQRSCGGGSCHIGQSTSGVDLTSYSSILKSVGAQYGEHIVIPGRADESALFEKIASDEPQFGSRMPLIGDLLTAGEIGTIRSWIRDGARRSHLLMRGDVDQDDELTITDAINILGFLFLGADEPDCLAQADSNGDGVSNLSDPVHILQFLFLGGENPGDLSEKETEDCEITGELSFQNIYDKVLAASCAFSSCHSSEMHRANLSFGTIDEAYEQLVGVDAFNTAAQEQELKRVAAGDPEKSFLLNKLTSPGPGEGNRMPANSPTPLSDSTINAIREWVLAGAPREGTISGVPAITDDPPPPIDRLPQPAIPENGMQLTIPPFTIGPRDEREIFYYMGKPFEDLGKEEVWVKRIDIHMLDYSHHFIMYQWTGAQDPPLGARPGGLAVINQRLVVASQQSFFSMSFPEGVGIKFSKDDRFDFNSHYVNLNGEESLLGEVYVNIFFAEPEEITTEVKPIFDFGGDILVPANRTTKANGTFPGRTTNFDPALGVNGRFARPTKIYALSSHMHRHGVRFTADHRRSNGSIGDRLYESFSWDDPVYKLFDPPLEFGVGEGIRYEATYTYDDPPTPNAPPLTWGPTSEDEMIILLGYYAVE